MYNQDTIIVLLLILHTGFVNHFELYNQALLNDLKYKMESTEIINKVA